MIKKTFNHSPVKKKKIFRDLLFQRVKIKLEINAKQNTLTSYISKKEKILGDNFSVSK